MQVHRLWMTLLLLGWYGLSLVAAQVPINAHTDLQGPVSLSGTLTPPALTGNVDNYNPTGLAAAQTLRLDGGAADRTITGIQGGVNGRLLTVINIGTTNNLVLATDTTSTVGHRFLFPASITLGPQNAVTLRYDGTTPRWRVFTGMGTGGDTTNMVTAVSAFGSGFAVYSTGTARTTASSGGHTYDAGAVTNEMLKCVVTAVNLTITTITRCVFVDTTSGPITLTLPNATINNNSVSHFAVYKTSADANALILAPASGDSLNFGTADATLTTTVQGHGFDIVEQSGATAGNWLAHPLVLTTGGGSALTVTQLSAASGTVTAPVCTGGGPYLYYRYNVSGPLTLPAVSGTCSDGQEMTFVLKSATPQDITFTTGAAGFSGDANLALPSTTTGGTIYDYYRYRYNSTAVRWLLVGSTQATTPLAVGAGGTGVATLAAHGVVVGQGAAPVTTAVPTAAYQCLMSDPTNPTTADPAFQACLEMGPILKTLTDNSAVNILTVAAATNTASSVRLTYQVDVLTATNQVQSEDGEVRCRLVNQNGVLSLNTCTETSTQSLGSGTLTTAWALSAANPAQLTLNANTSLTPSAGYPRLRYSVQSLGGQALVLQ